jgi:hypothetical protein
VIGSIVAAAAFYAFAATPEAAALKALYPRPGGTIRVTRVNRSGRFATVLTSGALMESSPVREPVFVERFGPGWQPVSLIYFQCDLRDMQTVTGPANATHLMTGMPAPNPDRGKCDPPIVDSGTSADIVAVRARMRGPLVPYVLISRNWALGEWYGAGGGSNLFHRTGGRWVFVAGGGGAMDIGLLRGHGVPLADACRFRRGLAIRPEDARICSAWSRF